MCAAFSQAGTFLIPSTLGAIRSIFFPPSGKKVDSSESRGLKLTKKIAAVEEGR